MNKNCKFCTEEFNAQRSTAEFCSTNCRVKYNNSTPQTFAIYGLRNPLTDKIFYVGCSCQNLKIRLRCHINDSLNVRAPRPSRKEEIIQQIIAAGKEPLIEIFEKVDTDKARDSEQKWIKELSTTCELTNFEVTGKGPYFKYPSVPDQRMKEIKVPEIKLPIATPGPGKVVLVGNVEKPKTLREILAGEGYVAAEKPKVYVPKVK